VTVISVLGVVFLWFAATLYVLQILEQTQNDEMQHMPDPIDKLNVSRLGQKWNKLRGGLEQQIQQRLHRSQSQASSVITAATGATTGTTATSAHTRSTKKQRHEAQERIDMRELAVTMKFDNPDGGAWKQGWDVKAKHVTESQPLEIIVVPHSHCDPGWIKTFDEYFRQQVKEIISTVVASLVKDERRTFVWAEISYFEWWWRDQKEPVKESVRKLLKSGQLEFVTGGWVQPDEANSELYAMEIQLQEGHDWIRRTFGAAYIPTSAWSIDPFGYSPTMAWLLHKYGFDSMLIQRVHYAVKKELASKQQLEFTWRQVWDDNDDDEYAGGSGSSGSTGKHDMFTHLMPFFSYDVPHTCGPDPAVCCQFDFKRDTCPWKKNPVKITENNIKERSLLLLDQYKKKASLYRGNTVLIPLGDDFRYQTEHEAEAQFTNYQRIFDYINANEAGVHVHFGTLSEYFKKVRGTFVPPVLKGSFFTYSDVDDHYWSGYFTSRAFDKALDRQLERVLYAASAMGGSKLELQEPRRTLSLFQHHDGVTGTAKDFVVEDYAKRIHDAISFTQKWIVQRMQRKFSKILLAVATSSKDGISDSSIQPCWLSNAPRGLSQNLCGDEGTVFVYNPLDIDQKCGDVVVTGKELVAAQLPCELPGSASRSNSPIVFDETTGLMIEPIREEWKVWKVNQGGAYLFFPGQLRDFDLKGDDVRVALGGYVVTTEFWKRTVVEREVPTKFGTTATVIDFVYETNLKADNEEWFVRFKSNVANGGKFHTDLNGFNFDTHHFRSDLPIQSQVFPMPTLASIEDDTLRMTVLSEHAQGTASLQDGSIDVWLDRRLAQDDGLGMGQAVKDNVPTRTRLRVVLEHGGYSTSGEFKVTPLGRQVWDELQHPLEMFGTHTKGVEGVKGGDEPPADYEATIRKAKERTEARARKRDERHRERVRTLLESDTEDSIGGAKGTFARLFNNFFGEHELDTDMAHDTDISLLVENHHLHHGHHGKKKHHRKARGESVREPVAERFTVDNTTVPLVFMVYKRVEYLKKAINSLRLSDFPKSRVPLIISHDGHVPEMVEYVDSLKNEFQVIQIFHPYSCFEHPDSFPGDDKELNKDYKGDIFGNPRSPWATCCKHHFTWMLNTAFAMKFDSLEVDNFFFLEEDYVVAPTFYSTIASGLNVMESLEKKLDGGFFGIALDPTEADNQVRIRNRDRPVLLQYYP
jgi:hypothetical protein